MNQYFVQCPKSLECMIGFSNVMCCVCQRKSKQSEITFRNLSITGIEISWLRYSRDMSNESIATRTKKGLDLEGICDTPMVPGWKLGAMADIIFQKFWQDRNGIIQIANEMLEEHFKDDRDVDFQSEIEETQRKIAIIDKKFDNLVDMRMAGEIDKTKFDEKKKSLFEEKDKLQKILESFQIDEEVSDEEYDNRLEILKYGLEQNFNFSTHSIPEEVIDAFVKEIIVYPDCFVWKLNIFDDDLKLQVEGRKNDPTVSLIESPTDGNSSTGGNSKQLKKWLKINRKLRFLLGLLSVEGFIRLTGEPLFVKKHGAEHMFVI